MNRDFPSLFKNHKIPTLDKIDIVQPSTSFNSTLESKQPETKAVMKWIQDNSFVLSISFHGGAVGAFWPYDDGSCQNDTPCISATPDNELMKVLATKFACSHADMHLGGGCNGKYIFPKGVSNGAMWYPIDGSMTDYNYLFSNCFEITVELTCCKYPFAKHLMPEWRKNQQSLVQFLHMAHMGIKGLITDENGDRVSGAKVEILGNAKKVTTNKRGEFWRLLLPGRYQVQAWGLCVGDTCKRSKIIGIEVKTDKPTIVNLILSTKGLV